MPVTLVVGLFSQLDPTEPLFLKTFIISKSGVPGVRNGCFQDILFSAKIHPKRRARDVTSEEQIALHGALRQTIGQMTEIGGRDSERDLFGQSSGYRRLLDNRSVGKPCPSCGTVISKMSLLGGAAYYCPTHQR